MRIALDARTIYSPTRRGIGKNLLDLYRHAAELRPQWQVLAYHRQTQPVDALLPSGTVDPRTIEMPGDRFDAWHRWRLPLAAWRDGATVLHCPANQCPVWMPLPTLVTIHDLIPLDVPGEATALEAKRFEQSVRTASRRAAWILCPSKYTRDRLVNDFGADKDRITVNPWASDSAIQQVAPRYFGPVLDRYGVSRPYVLHLGAAAPRKNTRRMLEAWAIIESGIRRKWRLLVVGLDDATLAQMTQLAERLGITSTVRLHGFAQEPDLSTLLSAAGVMAYPSLSEGFGLPILDAWMTGTPVLTSDCTSLPEVAGDAALLVDPTDTLAIAKGLARLIKDGVLRRDLVQRGRERLREFSWRATAQRFVAALEQAASAPPATRHRRAA